MRPSLIVTLVLAGVLPAMPGKAAQKFIPITGGSDADIQTNLISQFPIHVFKPANRLSPATTFKIAEAKLTGEAPVYNFWDAPNGTPLTLNLSMAGATHVDTLMNVMRPATGRRSPRSSSRGPQ